jgi:hypothetical protein
VDVEAPVVVAHPLGVTRVQAHANPQIDSTSGLELGQRALHIGRSVDGIRHRLECDEEGVSLGSNLDSAMAGQRVSEYPVMLI